MSTARQYELIYITPPETTEEVLAELHTQIGSIVERFGGSIANTENWGRRRLAYEINRHREGVYVLEIINGPGELTAELDRRLRVMDVVIRHLIVRVDEELAAAERAQKRRKDTVAARRVRRGLPPLPEPEPVSTETGAEGGEVPAAPAAADAGTVVTPAAPAAADAETVVTPAAPAAADAETVVMAAAPAEEASESVPPAAPQAEGETK